MQSHTNGLIPNTHYFNPIMLLQFIISVEEKESRDNTITPSTVAKKESKEMTF
ncbi:hypothetical protein SLEP1_g24780 [Rubroshorea leprosula]|uniref:Uncharacterized protein n=1 Tax=Rubroshorea leprosula TaxID=152421 RepID=A0AAV5JQH1_9ROSI|nr:hypothetical protein SLEP1_g24780 [Rubroshorea leprosula]